ncbi:MAG TPA: DUF488 family protein [Acidimicrobiia bacterium]|nr:DUF488 family protein [Acidimicrobiia bacterium]
MTTRYGGPEIRRIYDDCGGSTGYRVLVDRLWPRGIKKSDADLDEWLKDAAPSTELRRWYGHDPERFAEFTRRYRAELQRPPASGAVDHLLELASTRLTVLLTATGDVEHSGARVLRDHLASRTDRTGRRDAAR